MPLRERAALRVFTDQPRVETLQAERAEGHCLRRRPIYHAFLDARESIGDVHLLKSWMAGEARGKIDGLLGQLSQFPSVIAGRLVSVEIPKLTECHALPLVRECSAAAILLVGRVLKLGHEGQTLLVFLLEVRPYFFADALHLLLAHDSLLYQLVGIRLGESLLEAFNVLVHGWLREGRLINLVVAMLSEADHVDQDVLPESLPVLDHELAHAKHRLGGRGCIGCIQSQNRNAEAFDDV